MVTLDRTHLHQGPILEKTDFARFSIYVQLLQEMSRSLITMEHNNQRDSTNLEHLLHDHPRLGQLAKRHRSQVKIDTECYDRVRDDLLTLRDFRADRHRRILNSR
jgi:hypothetical protein